MNRHLIVITVCVWLTCVSAFASASFEDKVSGKGTIRLVGWAKLRGEFKIYSDVASMNAGLSFPHCISGVFASQAEIVKSLLVFDGQLVTLTGELFTYADLPDDGRPELPRKMVASSVVFNGCLGANVLLIKKIELASKADSLVN